MKEKFPVFQNLTYDASSKCILGVDTEGRVWKRKRYGKLEEYWIRDTDRFVGINGRCSRGKFKEGECQPDTYSTAQEVMEEPTTSGQHSASNSVNEEGLASGFLIPGCKNVFDQL